MPMYMYNHKGVDTRGASGADPEGGPGGQWTPLGSVISHFILLN